MELININIWIIVSTLAIAVLLWSVIAGRTLNLLEQDVLKNWQNVLVKSGKRHDTIPVILEILKSDLGESEVVKKIIDTRSRAMHEYQPNGTKIIYEHDLTTAMNELLNQAMANEVAQKDAIFLEMTTDYRQAGKELLESGAIYNDKVRSYNKVVNNKFYTLWALIFGFKEANIFEIEI